MVIFLDGFWCWDGQPRSAHNDAGVNLLIDAGTNDQNAQKAIAAVLGVCLICPYVFA